jgi:hypothetical protein
MMDCEMSNEPGSPCQEVAIRCVEEPWTPGCFRINVCAEHLADMLGLGFHDRGPVCCGLTRKLPLKDAREMGGYDPSDLDGAGSWSGGPGRFSR